MVNSVMEFEYVAELLISMTLATVVWTLKEVHQIRIDMAKWVTTLEQIQVRLGELTERVDELGVQVESLARKIVVVESNNSRLDEAVEHLDNWLARLTTRVAAIEGALPTVIRREQPDS